MRQEYINEASDKLPLRGIKCVNYYKEIGDTYIGYYTVYLRVCHGGNTPEDFEKFSSVGEINFKHYEQAIAFVLARMTGKFDRKLPDGIQTPFVGTEDDEMWSFDLQERLHERYIGEEWHSDPEWDISKRCDSEIKVRRGISEEPAIYKGIGHMAILGIAHIVDTISKDHHLSNERRSKISMFSYRDKIFIPTWFDSTRPLVSGTLIGIGSEAPEEVKHVNYHADFVSFYEFGTVVRELGNYYLDGALLYSNGKLVSDPDYEIIEWASDDGILEWIANNYPEAKRFCFEMESGSMGYIKKRIRRKKGEMNDS